MPRWRRMPLVLCVIVATLLGATTVGAAMPRQRGIAIFVDPGAVSSPTALDEAQATFDYSTSLGANSVALSFPFVMTNGESNDPHALAGVTPTPALLGQMIDEAHGDGLAVQLRPLLFEGNLGSGVWRGVIQPSDPAAWFANYQTFLAPYLEMAQQQGSAGFYLESELDSLVTSGRRHFWTSLATWAAGLYSGSLLASTSHAAYLQGPSISQGYDDYDPLFVPDSTGVPTLTKDLEHSLASDAIPGASTHLVLSEVGIAAVAHAYWQPWQFSVTGPVKPKVQAKWFSAMCDMVLARHLRGLYFWDLDMASFSLLGQPGNPSSWVATPAAQAIASCFTKMGAS